MVSPGVTRHPSNLPEGKKIEGAIVCPRVRLRTRQSEAIRVASPPTSPTCAFTLAVAVAVVIGFPVRRPGVPHRRGLPRTPGRRRGGGRAPTGAPHVCGRHSPRRKILSTGWTNLGELNPRLLTGLHYPKMLLVHPAHP